MNHPSGHAKKRRLATPRKQVQLNLQRRSPRAPEGGDIEIEPKRIFWRWVVLVALIHVALFVLVAFYSELTPPPKPPEQFMSLLPAGDLVKGTPGVQEAPKLGASTPAPSKPAPTPPPTPEVAPPKPTPPVAVKPPPDLTKIVKNDVPAEVPVPTPPKPKPKVKVDLNLVDRPSDKPTVKPKHTPKPAPSVAQEETDTQRESNAPSTDTGLSKEQIAQKLGEKLQAEGTSRAEKTGVSGSTHASRSDFKDFYNAIRNQVMDHWSSPNLADSTEQVPVVEIYVEKDGSVPPERVRLVQSSGNQAYDDSALEAARSLGHLYQPLPEGCPPEVSINFKLNR